MMRLKRQSPATQVIEKQQDRRIVVREIKFRAWDGERMLNRTLFDRDWYSNDNKCVCCAMPNDARLLKVMQYTGLKDKNGVEIYFGDILATSNLDTGHDLWNIHDQGYTVVQERKDELGVAFSRWWMSDSDDSDSMYSSRFVEVVGNIHEHPHLLNA